MSNEVTKTVDPHITLDLIVNTTITLTEQQWDEIKEIKGGRRESIDFYSDSSIYRAIFAHINKSINLAEYIDEILFNEIDGEKLTED